MVNDFLPLLEKYLTSRLSKKKLLLLAEFLTLLYKWNRYHNLTAIKSYKKIVTKQVIDSITTSPFLYRNRIIDIGSGSGFPGIPLAIVNSDKHFSLIDSNYKKCSFLQYVSTLLRLKNVEVINDRCEKFSSVHRYTSIISKNVASIVKILELSSHLGANDCNFIFMKNKYYKNELIELDKSKFVLKQTECVSIPNLKDKRYIVVIKFC